MPSDPISRATANTVAIANPSEAGPATTGWRSFAEICAEVARRMGGRSDLDPASVELHVNEAYMDICSSFKLLMLDATIGWTAPGLEPFFALPSSIREVVKLSLRADSGTGAKALPLEKIEMEEYRKYPEYADAHSVRQPYAYTISADRTLALWPAPQWDVEFSMEVMMRPAILVQPTDYPVLTDEWIESLTILAVSKAASALNEFELAAQRYNEYLGYARSRRNERAEQREGIRGGISIARNMRDVIQPTRRGVR